METRKLQQVGGGTYTVSIPKDWADDHSLEAGMELYLYTHSDGSIVVRDAETDAGALAAVELVVDGADPALVERALRSAHAAGFETVTLRPGTGSDGGAGSGEFTDEQRRAARSVVRTLVGTDLFVDTAREITVQHLLDAGTVSVRQSVVQLQFSAQSIHEGATDAVLAGDPDAAARLAERRDEADRLCRMVARHFARSLVSFGEVDRLGVSRPDLFDYYVTARALERVADLGIELAGTVDDAGQGLPEEVGESLRETARAAREAVGDATTAVLDGATAPAAQSLLADCHAVVDRADAIEGALVCDHDVTAPTAVRTVRAVDAVRRTADCGTTVAETALRAAIRSTAADGRPTEVSRTGGSKR